MQDAEDPWRADWRYKPWMTRRRPHAGSRLLRPCLPDRPRPWPWTATPSALAFPAAFTVAPKGSRILFGERFTGRISQLHPATGMSTPFFTVPDVATIGHQGLLGLALHPSYPSDGRVWAFVTRKVSGTATNQLLRIRADGNGFAVLRRLPTAELRNGGRIMFGPDGKLCVVVGDNESPNLAQNLGSLAGKMLRLNADGGAHRQPTRRKPDHRLRHPQLLRVHLRSPDRPPLGRRTTARNATTRSTSSPASGSGTLAGARRRHAARRSRRPATPTGTGPAQCCRGSSSPIRWR
jgi:glucose/sorbosone dehydrogenase